VQKLGVALLRGLRGRCPACGRTRLFRGFLRVVPACANCNAPLGRVRADDAPPYFTIVLVGHLVIPLTFIADRTWQPPLWAETTVGAAAMLGLALVLMRPVKGATVGLMLWLGLIEAEAATPDTDAVRGA
jgi:uncharacterized protein (DUF983 family)